MLLHPLNFHLLILRFFSDANLEGWGGIDQVTETIGRWNCIENKFHINSPELQAAFFCLKLSVKIKPDYIVLLKLDISTAVAYINKNGGPFQSLVTN